mmetsp:Transcript_38/g.141  ORF Transcript_38/g.141 Transcript_38/m.141 type:complete len:228 (-) Transcript_38:1622-2305(-)
MAAQALLPALVLLATGVGCATLASPIGFLCLLAFFPLFFATGWFSLASSGSAARSQKSSAKLGWCNGPGSGWPCTISTELTSSFSLSSRSLVSARGDPTGRDGERLAWYLLRVATVASFIRLSRTVRPSFSWRCLSSCSSSVSFSIAALAFSWVVSSSSSDLKLSTRACSFSSLALWIAPISALASESSASAALRARLRSSASALLESVAPGAALLAAPTSASSLAW